MTHFFDYSKLWEILKKRGLKQQYLIDNGIHRATIYKMKRCENLTTDVIITICELLNCKPSQIMEYKSIEIPEPEPDRKTE